MSAKENFIDALHNLIEAQQAVAEEDDNPFNLGMPTHMGLDDDTFISRDELNSIQSKLNSAINDNRQFARVWTKSIEMLQWFNSVV